MKIERRGRPSKGLTARLMVYLKDGEKEELEVFARRKGRSMTDVAREFIMEGIRRDGARRVQ